MTGDFKKDIKAITEKLDKDALASEFTVTHKVQSGNTIYVIARDQLKKETGKNPTEKEIYTRIAEIALLNDNMNVDRPALIVVGHTIKIGKAPAATSVGNGEGDESITDGSEVTEKKTPRQQFNDAIKKIASKMNKEQVAAELTREQTIADDATLYGIAKQSLIDEGISEPTAPQINKRIAEIALVNDAISLDNVAKIPVGKTIKVGKGQGAGNSDEAQGNDPVRGRHNDPVSEQPLSYEGALVINSGVDLNGWTKASGEGATVELKVDDTLTVSADKYTKTTGEGESATTETKYICEIDGIRLEASTADELLKEAKKLKNALDKFTAVECEDDGAKKDRLVEGINALLDEFGTEDAVVKALGHLVAARATVPADFYEKRMISLINSMNPKVYEKFVEKIDGDTDNAPFQADINNNPKILEEFAKVRKDLYNKHEYGLLTDKEKAVKAHLDNFGNSRVVINAKDRVAEVTDDNGNVITPEQAAVVAKELVVNPDGSTRWNAILDEGSSVDWVMASGTEEGKELVNDFVLELKAADTDEKKAALFKKYINDAEATKDPKFLRTLAINHDNLHASKEDVSALIKKITPYSLININTNAGQFTDEANGKEVSVEYINKLLSFDFKADELYRLDACKYGIENMSKLSVKEKIEAKKGLLANFFVTEGEGENQTVKLKDFGDKLPYSGMKALVELVNDVGTDAHKKALVNMITAENIREHNFADFLNENLPTPILKERYSAIIEGMTKKDEVTALIEKLKPRHIDLIDYQKATEKFDGYHPEVHLGEQAKEECEILRKITLADILPNIQQDGEGEETYYKVRFNVAIEEAVWFSEVEINANTREELIKKAERYIELQNICYEAYSDDSKSTDVEKEQNVTRLNQLWDEAGDDVEFKAFVARSVKNVALELPHDNELISKILESKNAYILNSLIAGGDLYYTNTRSEANFNKEHVNTMFEILQEKAEDSEFYEIRSGFAGILSDKKYYDMLTSEQQAELYGKLSTSTKMKVLQHSVADPDKYTEEVLKLGLVNNKDAMMYYDPARMNSNDIHIVTEGETFNGILIRYLMKKDAEGKYINLKNFPQLEASFKRNPEKWTEERIQKALNIYVETFGDAMVKHMWDMEHGVGAVKLMPGHKIPLSKINWEELQPNYTDYLLRY